MTLLMREKEIAEENFEKGVKEGLKEGIKLLKEFNIPNNEIVKRIMKDYHLTEEEAKTYL